MSSKPLFQYTYNIAKIEKITLFYAFLNYKQYKVYYDHIMQLHILHKQDSMRKHFLQLLGHFKVAHH